MLFDVEQQAYKRVTIVPEEVCIGCAFFGNEHDEDPFCIMEEDTKKCRVAQALGKYDKKDVENERPVTEKKVVLRKLNVAKKVSVAPMPFEKRKPVEVAKPIEAAKPVEVAKPVEAVKPAIAAPESPIKVAIIAGNAQATISWSPVKGATAYNIYWNTKGNVNVSDRKLAGVSSPYTHSDLMGGMTFYYVVTAENAGGESAPSIEMYRSFPKINACFA